MIIQCPECSKKYKVAGDLIGEGGRLVRCAACEYEWLARPEDADSPIVLDVANEYIEDSKIEEIVATVAPEGSSDDVAHAEDLHSLLGRDRIVAPEAIENKIEVAEEKGVTDIEQIATQNIEQEVSGVGEVENTVKPMVEEQKLDVQEDIPDKVITEAKEHSPDIPSISEVIANFNPPQMKQKVDGCNIWGQAGITILSLLMAILIVFAPIAVIWPQMLLSEVPYFEMVLGYIGVHDNSGVRVGKVSISSQHSEKSIEVQVDVDINNSSHVERFVQKIRFISYDAQMQPLGHLTLDIASAIEGNSTKKVQGMLHNLPISTQYISIDIGDGAALMLRDMGSLYKFTK